MSLRIDTVRFGTQMFMIILFSLMVLTAMIYFNLILILASFVLAFIFGRFFCGWFCPLGFWTERILPKTSGDAEPPEVLKNVHLRTLFVMLFVIGFIGVWYLSKVDRSIFPFLMMGTMFGLATLLGTIDEDSTPIFSTRCIRCFECVETCPNGSIDLIKNVIDDDKDSLTEIKEGVMEDAR